MGQYSGKVRFIEKPGVQDVVVAMWQNVILYPEVKVQVRELLRVVGIVAPFAPTGVGTQRVLWVLDLQGQYSVIIRFIEKPGVQDERGRHVAKRSSE